MEEKKLHNRGITAKLRMKFEQNPGLVLYVRDLADEFGVDPRVIQQSVANMIRETGQPTVHIRAAAWIWSPQGRAQRARRVFEEIGTTKDGKLIVQADDLTLYLATEM